MVWEEGVVSDLADISAAGLGFSDMIIYNTRYLLGLYVLFFETGVVNIKVEGLEDVASCVVKEIYSMTSC